MVMYREVEVWIVTFLFSAIDSDDYSNKPSRFIPGLHSPVSRGWETRLDLRVSIIALGERKSLPLSGIVDRFPFIQPGMQSL